LQIISIFKKIFIMQLNEKQVNQIVSLLNELPIKQMPIAEAIVKIMSPNQDAKTEETKDEKPESKKK
tara:strand:- start:2341 stop:2541 length:201 start_codon:yes stop_codon:yes gene_type:complete